MDLRTNTSIHGLVATYCRRPPAQASQRIIRPYCKRVFFFSPLFNSLLTFLLKDEDYVSSFHMRFTVRHGAIREAFLWGLDFAESIEDSKQAVKDAFANVPVHRLDFLPKLLPLIKHEPESLKKAVQMSDFLNGVFGNNPSPLRAPYLAPKNAVELAIEEAMAAAEPNKGDTEAGAEDDDVDEILPSWERDEDQEEEDQILTQPQDDDDDDAGSETNSRELKQEWSQEQVRAKLQELIKDSQ